MPFNDIYIHTTDFAFNRLIFNNNFVKKNNYEKA